MIIHQHDRPGYERPIYAPENGQVYGQDRRDVMRKANAAYMYGKPLTAVLDEMEEIAGLANRLLARSKAAAKRALPAPVKTPYTNSYVRAIDGALMVEIGGHGFVSETWAVRNGLLPNRHTTEAVAARKEARAARKEHSKTKGVRRVFV